MSDSKCGIRDLVADLRRPNKNWTRRAWAADVVHSWLCTHGLHWRIVFSYEAIPAYLGEDPTPPEAGWCCNYCGKLRDPYTWPLRERTIWRLKAWWYERPGGKFDKEWRSV